MVILSLFESLWTSWLIEALAFDISAAGIPPKVGILEGYSGPRIFDDYSRRRCGSDHSWPEPSLSCRNPA